MFEKAVAFTSVGTDWAIAYKQKTGQLWMGPTYSPLHPQCKCCTTERPSGSVLWTEPSASTPYPEPCFLSASSYSTSFTGSPTKCCDTRTSTPTCNRSWLHHLLILLLLFFSYISSFEPKPPVILTLEVYFKGIFTQEIPSVLKPCAQV